MEKVKTVYVSEPTFLTPIDIQYRMCIDSLPTVEMPRLGSPDDVEVDYQATYGKKRVRTLRGKK